MFWSRLLFCTGFSFWCRLSFWTGFVYPTFCFFIFMFLVLILVFGAHYILGPDFEPTFIFWLYSKILSRFSFFWLVVGWVAEGGPVCGSIGQWPHISHFKCGLWWWLGVGFNIIHSYYFRNIIYIFILFINRAVPAYQPIKNWLWWWGGAGFDDDQQATGQPLNLTTSRTTEQLKESFENVLRENSAKMQATGVSMHLPRLAIWISI